MYAPYFVQIFICPQTFGLLPPLWYCEQCCYEYGHANISLRSCFKFLRKYIQQQDHLLHKLYISLRLPSGTKFLYSYEIKLRIQDISLMLWCLREERGPFLMRPQLCSLEVASMFIILWKLFSLSRISLYLYWFLALATRQSENISILFPFSRLLRWSTKASFKFQKFLASLIYTEVSVKLFLF